MVDKKVHSMDQRWADQMVDASAELMAPPTALHSAVWKVDHLADQTVR